MSRSSGRFQQQKHTTTTTSRRILLLFVMMMLCYASPGVSNFPPITLAMEQSESSILSCPCTKLQSAFVAAPTRVLSTRQPCPSATCSTLVPYKSSKTIQSPANQISVHPNNMQSRRLLATLRPQDNLVSGLAEISFACSLGVLWSESAVLRTGCGPLNFSDTLERLCYQGTIVFAGLSLFQFIVSQGRTISGTLQQEEILGPLNPWTLWQVRVAESASILAVLGAFVALGSQYFHGAQIDGLSGIDVSLCRALRDL